MMTTIDKAGRVVIPSRIRAQAGLEPGTELEVTLEEGVVRLVKSAPGPELKRVGGRLVASPSVPPEKRVHVNLGRLIEEERDRWPL
jgi:AbrB family looped-hinge helix DNA binding protein